jgi:hypothetical protein
MAIVIVEHAPNAFNRQQAADRAQGNLALPQESSNENSPRRGPGHSAGSRRQRRRLRLPTEARIVEVLRSDARNVVSLIAEEDGVPGAP